LGKGIVVRGRGVWGRPGQVLVVVRGSVQFRHGEAWFTAIGFVDEVFFVVQFGVNVPLFVIMLRLGFRLLRYQPGLQLAGQVTDFVLAAGAGGGVVRVAQPDAPLQQRA